MSAGVSSVVRRRRTIDLPNGKRIEVEALSIKDYGQVREQACAEYKRSLIKTVTDNQDLLPDSEKDGAVGRAFEKAMQLTPDALPTKTVPIPDTNKTRDLPYADWWMGMTIPGILYSTWLAMRKCPGQESLTRDDVEAMFEDQGEAIEEAGEAIADLTRPRLGNSEPPAAKTGTPAQAG